MNREYAEKVEVLLRLLPIVMEEKVFAVHEGGNHETVHTVLLDDTIYYNDEGTGGTANLHLAAAKERNEETGYNGGEDTGFRGGTRSNAESDGQGKGDNTHNNTGQKVLNEVLLAISVLKDRKKFRSEISFDSHIFSLVKKTAAKVRFLKYFNKEYFKNF